MNNEEIKEHLSSLTTQLDWLYGLHNEVLILPKENTKDHPEREELIEWIKDTQRSIRRFTNILTARK